MRKIVMGGESYGIRCDLNVLEAIEEKYGSIDAITKERSITSAKFLIAEMINEQNRDTNNPERFTPEEVGARLTFPEYREAWPEILAEFLDCVIVKKK